MRGHGGDAPDRQHLGIDGPLGEHHDGEHHDAADLDGDHGPDDQHDGRGDHDHRHRDQHHGCIDDRVDDRDVEHVDLERGQRLDDRDDGRHRTHLWQLQLGSAVREWLLQSGGVLRRVGVVHGSGGLQQHRAV
jgi:hypothetical protein